MWEFYPLDLGTAQLKKRILLNGAYIKEGLDTTIAVPSTAWLFINLETNQHVLVDTGPSKDPSWGKKYHNQYTRTPEQLLDYQLQSFGSSVEQIETVILTHLHWDHAYGVFELPKAKVIVQKQELFYALTPRASDAVIYEVDLKFQLPYFLRFFQQIELIDGDCQLFEDFSVIQLPGHSPGSQGIVAETAVGKIVVAGDLVNTFQNWKERIPCGITTSLEDCFSSFEKLDLLEAIILPSHDYAVFDYVKSLKTAKARNELALRG